jgi:hypothetical protein
MDAYAAADHARLGAARRDRAVRGETQLVRIQYRTSEQARAQLYIGGEPKTFVHAFVRVGKIDWGRRPRST